jgi:hypothetical protein
MNRRRVSAVLLGLALAAPAAAQEGTWAISGNARYVARYDGHKLSGNIPFAVIATLRSDGTYEVTGPVCGSEPVVLTGRWTPGSDRALRSIVRKGLHANLTSCGSEVVRVRALAVHQRTAPGGTITGGFVARLRYGISGDGDAETIRARVHGDYTGTRTDR